MSHKLWDSLTLLVMAALMLVGMAAVAFVIYLWFHGVCQSALVMWGWNPVMTTVIAILIAFFVQKPGMIAMAIYGFVGTVWWLNWPWYGSLALYLPSLAVVFSAALVTIFLGLVALMLETFERIRK